MNLATAVVSIFLIVIVILILRYMIKSRRNGGACSGCSGCGGSCTGCDLAGHKQ